VTKCTGSSDQKLLFGRIGRRSIEADFSGGDLSSDGGLLLLRQTDQIIGLTQAAAHAMHDRRAPSRIEHDLHTLVSQRVFALCAGYEDLNDHQRLRHDTLMQTAVGRSDSLGSAPTLCRLENRASAGDCARLSAILVEQFLAAHTSAPESITLDVDASDVPLHGDQERSEFHGYYDHYCYLPLYVFCGDHLLASYLRKSRIDGAKNVTALVKVIVARIRHDWPSTRILIRGDSGFCRQRLLRFCEANALYYVIGLARNARLERAVAADEARLRGAFEATGVKQRQCIEMRYAAGSWALERRVVARLEYGDKGNNPRYVVTNLAIDEFDANALYDTLYCARGEAENRIKEVQLDLFGTRASCHRFLANQFRLLLAALSYTLMQAVKRLALTGSDLSRANTQTIRTRLMKIGASIDQNTRRIRVKLASNHPLRALFADAAQRLAQLCASLHARAAKSALRGVP
jgi:hypothetical protein